MFRAVREWWDRGVGKRTARLFAFELTVVMIGVLAAQQVSNWADRRSSLQRVEGVHRDLFHSFEQYRRIAIGYRVAIPCLEQRVDLLLRLVGDRQPVEPSLVATPEMWGMGPDQISAENEQLLRERYGDAVADRIGSMEFNLKTSDENSRALMQHWFEFERLDPRHGAVADSDRAAVRSAAVRIKGNLFALRKSSRLIEQIVTELGVRSGRGESMKPVSSCDEVWRTGKAYQHKA